MKLEKIDKIILAYKEYQEISEWVQNQRFDSVDITLNEGMVILNDIEYRGFNMQMGIYFRIDQSTGDIFVQQYDITDMTPLISAKIDERFFKDGYIDINIKDRWRGLMKRDELEKNIRISVLTVLDIFQYMNHYQENVVVTEESKLVRKSPRHSKSKNKKSNVVSLKNKKYTFVNTKNTKTDSKYNRHKEIWSVRGHWRHYKSGVKVWIKPHTKGAGEVKEGKIYKNTPMSI